MSSRAFARGEGVEEGVCPPEQTFQIRTLPVVVRQGVAEGMIGLVGGRAGHEILRMTVVGAISKRWVVDRKVQCAFRAGSGDRGGQQRRRRSNRSSEATGDERGNVLASGARPSAPCVTPRLQNRTRSYRRRPAAAAWGYRAGPWRWPLGDGPGSDTASNWVITRRARIPVSDAVQRCARCGFGPLRLKAGAAHAFVTRVRTSPSVSCK